MVLFNKEPETHDFTKILKASIKNTFKWLAVNKSVINTFVLHKDRPFLIVDVSKGFTKGHN